jgi:hypothetical protein
MPRPKGSKNVTVEQKFVHGIKEEVYPDIVGAQKDQIQYAKYLFLKENDPALLMAHVNNFCMNLGYQCQGGVSVTNYRGLDGNIVMVYAQAMVRREG